MDTLTGLYLLLQLDAIRSYIHGLSVVCIVISTILFLTGVLKATATENFDSLHPFIKPIIISGILGMFLGFTNSLIPTTERAALMIVGAKVIDSNTTSILSNIPAKYASILEKKADAYMKTLDSK